MEQNKKESYETIYLDVMVNGLFHTQLVYKHCTIFKLSQDDLRKFVIEKRPTLRNKKFEVEISKNRVKK